MDESETVLLRRENRALRQDLAAQQSATIQSLLALTSRQQETIDRVIVAKFDRPVVAAGEDAAAAVQPVMIPIEHLADVMEIESDAEFLETVHGD